MITPAYLRQEDSAKYLSIGPRTIRDWMKRGILPYHKPCKKVCLFAVADLDRAMKKYRVEAGHVA